MRRLPVTALVLVAAAALVPSARGAELPPTPTPPPAGTTFFGEVEVRRITVEARVIGRDGEPVTGLGPVDFRISVDGVPTTPESVDWVEFDRPRRDVEEAPGTTDAAPAASATLPPPPSRLLVFFFQQDFAFASERIGGLMRMAHRAARFVDELAPTDKVAVATYESHLDLRLDLTSDRERILDAVKVTSLFGRPSAPDTDDEPSLLDHLDPDEAMDAAKPETALRLIAEALEPLPGNKAIVLFGWGLGRLQGRRVVMPQDYGEARLVLTRAHIPVYSIDVTEADFHTLEVGLQKAAVDTGGFYAKTYHHPAGAMKRLDRALSGHYVLTFSSPIPDRGWHSLLVEVVGVKGARVYAKNSFVD